MAEDLQALIAKLHEVQMEEARVEGDEPETIPPGATEEELAAL